MKRTPLVRKTALKRTSSIKASPSKRLEPERPLATWCELGLPGCRGRAVHRHERKLRSQGGDGSPANTRSLCHWCHRRIHDSVTISYANGWLVEHWRDPATVPWKTPGGLAQQLGLDGL